MCYHSMREHLVYINIRYDYVLRLKEVIYALVITSNPICARNYLRYQQKEFPAKKFLIRFRNKSKNLCVSVRMYAGIMRLFTYHVFNRSNELVAKPIISHENVTLSSIIVIKYYT